MRIFVTAGNTQVLIDRVRCITNIFTGRTGAAIALEAYRRGHQVTLATSHPDTIDVTPRDAARWQCLTYRTYDDLDALMSRHVPAQEAIIHAAAVSDYRAAGIYAPAEKTRFQEDDLTWRAQRGQLPKLVDRAAGKVKSDAPELWLRLERTPKLVDKVRHEWNYHGILVKFKLEVGLDEAKLCLLAERSRRHSAADWMVANTLEGAGEWALLGSAEKYRKVTRRELPAALLESLENHYEENRLG